MPFDGSGNFSRLYSWQSDRDNGIRILASKMDGEFDNFASGMNQVFFRNGLVPMSGNLNMGQNYLLGLGAGSVGSLSMRWADDPNSGLYLNGYNKPTLVANGVGRLEANTAGVNVTGTLNSSGNLTENASRVWTAATFTPGNYALLSGAVFTGGVIQKGNSYIRVEGTGNVAPGTTTGVGAEIYNNGTEAVYSGFNATTAATAPLRLIGNPVRVAVGPTNVLGATFDTSGLSVVGGVSASGTSAFAGATFSAGVTFNGAMGSTSSINAANGYQIAGNSTLTAGAGYTNLYAGATAINFVNAAGSVALASLTSGGAFNAIGAITQNGSQVWHAGNFNPANYAALSGANFTGNVTAPALLAMSGGNGYVDMVPGGASTTGYVEFWRAGGGAREGYIGNATVGGPIQYSASGGHQFLGGGITTPSLASSGAITQGGNQVWHAGNFNPANYAALTGAAFSGPISAIATTIGASGWYMAATFTAANDAMLRLGSTSPNKYSSIGSGSDGTMYFLVNGSAGAIGTQALSFAPSGAALFGGKISRDATCSIDVSGQYVVFSVDSGDSMLYDRTNNKFLFSIANTTVASLDGSGNLTVKGNITSTNGGAVS